MSLPGSWDLIFFVICRYPSGEAPIDRAMAGIAGAKGTICYDIYDAPGAENRCALAQAEGVKDLNSEVLA